MTIQYLSLKDITALHFEEYQQAIAKVMARGWYLQGEETKAFENEYADYCHARHCIGVANGLDALTLMLRASMELGYMHEGDEVIVPANTYIATILAITENHLTPVLVEPDINTFQIDASKIEEALTQRTRAIMLVNLYGYQSYSQHIGELCRERELLLFVDNAQGHGLPLPECTAVAHSFYPGKNLGAFGDAGAVTTNDDALAETVRTLANYGSSRKYVFDYQGRNSRIDETNAAILRIKLQYLDNDNKRRREIAKRYCNEITNTAITLPRYDHEAVYHIFPILTSQRDQLQEYLKENNIGTVIHYPIPPHKQKAYKEWNNLEFPITERIHACELSLPLNQAMTNEEVAYVINVINNWR